MSEVTKDEMIGLIYGFAASNPDYRKTLLKDPKGLLAKQMQQDLPDNLKVTVVEETADTFYLVAPYVPAAGDELSDDDLEKVAGGKGKGGGGGRSHEEKQNRYTCNDTKGVGTRVEINTTVSG
jgi:hypothetical protein